jgi:hypothetical protein
VYGGVLDVVEHHDGLHVRGASAWAAAQLGQHFPGLEHGDGPVAERSEFGVSAVDRLLAA